VTSIINLQDILDYLAESTDGDYSQYIDKVAAYRNEFGAS